MDHDEIGQLRARSAAWRLLRADTAPLILSFLGQIFVEENVREIPAVALTERLEDVLYALTADRAPDDPGEPAYGQSAKAYLDAWTAPGAGWLRKYYRAGSEEPHYDATPDLEKAVGFVASLKARDFVGTESRLNTLFELLRQLAYGTEADPEKKLDSLRRQRDAVDAEIARVEGGDLALLDTLGQRDRLQQFAVMARELLADFREVEANFRHLDRGLREQIAGWTGSKGDLVEGAVATRGAIGDSDQGRSFAAFYDLLLSAHRQAELSDLLEQTLTLDSAAGLDPRLRHVHHDWLAAGERTQATVHALSEQLRRFLDDHVWLENRRIVELLRSVEAAALRVRDEDAGDLPGMSIEEMAPTVVLPMERRLYAPKVRVPIDSTGRGAGDGDFEGAALFAQVHVDTAALAERVRLELATSAQISLGTLLERQPLTLGLGELVGYLSLGDVGFDLVFDDDVTESVSWSDGEGTVRVATLPRLHFVRRVPVTAGGRRG